MIQAFKQKGKIILYANCCPTKTTLHNINFLTIIIEDLLNELLGFEKGNMIYFWDKVWPILYKLCASSRRNSVRRKKKKPILWEQPLETGKRHSSHSWVRSLGEFAQDKCTGRICLCYRRQAWKRPSIGKAAVQTLQKILQQVHHWVDFWWWLPRDWGREGRREGTSVRFRPW